MENIWYLENRYELVYNHIIVVSSLQIIITESAYLDTENCCIRFAYKIIKLIINLSSIV